MARQYVIGGLSPGVINEQAVRQYVGPNGVINEQQSSGGVVTNLSLQATSACVAILTRRTGKPIGAVSACIAGLTRRTSKALLASSACVALLNVMRVYLVSGLASSAAVALRGPLAIGKVLRASSAAVALRGAMGLGKKCLATTATVALLTRRTGKAFRASCAAVATMSKSSGAPTVTALASSNAVASLTLVRVKRIVAQSMSIATLFFRPFRFLLGSRGAPVTLTGESARGSTLNGGKSRTDLTGSDR